MELDNSNGIGQWAGPGHWNNPGLLISSRNDQGDGSPPSPPGKGAPRRISEVQVRTQFSLFCVLASPLLISGSVLYMSDGDLATYTDLEAIAISQDAAGHQGVRLVGPPLVSPRGNPSGGASVWGRRLGANGTAFALVFVNTDGKAADISCNSTCLLTALGRAPPSGSRLSARDVWGKADLPPVPIGQGWTAKNVSGDGCALLVLHVLPPLAAAEASSPGSAGSGGNRDHCTDAVSCSLNGQCSNSAGSGCVCTQGW
jgi:hypothetical protein